MAASLVLMLTGVASLGADVGVIWMVSTRRWEARSAFLTTQLMSGVLGLAVAAIGLSAYALGARSLLSGVSPTMAIIVAATVPFALSAAFSSQVALSEDRSEVAAGVLGVQAAAVVVAVAALTATEGLNGAILGLLVGSLAGAATGWVWVGGLERVQPERSSSRTIDWGRLWESIRFGITAYLTGVLALLMLRFDLLVLNASAPSADVGYYTVAVAVTNLIWVLPAALGAVLLPRGAALSSSAETAHVRDATETKSLRHTTLILALAVAASVIGLVLLLKPIYGGPFGHALGPALLLIPGAVGVGYATVMSAGLMARGHSRFLLISAGATTLPAVGLYLLLVPNYGADGASVASSIAYLINFAMIAYFLGRVSGLPTLRRLMAGREEIADYRNAIIRLRRAISAHRAG